MILGADSRGEFREEDQLCAARIARALVRRRLRASADAATDDVIERFGEAPDDAFLDGRSATYLRDTGQERDLAFVLEHIDDLDAVFAIEDGEVRAVAAPPDRAPAWRRPASSRAAQRAEAAAPRQLGHSDENGQRVVAREPRRLANARGSDRSQRAERDVAATAVDDRRA